MYFYYQYITINYYEDGLHTIKLMVKVYLREISMSLLFLTERFDRFDFDLLCATRIDLLTGQAARKQMTSCFKVDLWTLIVRNINYLF